MEKMLTKGVSDQNSSIQRKKINPKKDISRKTIIKSSLASDLTIQWKRVRLKF